MRSKGWLVVLIGLALFLQGCHTFQGAKEGFKQDFEFLKQSDAWMRKHLW